MALSVYRPILVEVQEDTCFYCHQLLHRQGDVDHFIPWSKYPVDLGHNFVLAHKMCNTKKRDFLAAEEHLEGWVERNNLHGRKLSQFFVQARIANNLESSISIANWAYSQTASNNGLVWVAGIECCHLGTRWKLLLA